MAIAFQSVTSAVLCTAAKCLTVSTPACTVACDLLIFALARDTGAGAVSVGQIVLHYSFVRMLVLTGQI